MAERRDFIAAAQADPFVIRHALAILDGSASMSGSSPAESFMPLANHEQVVAWSGMKIGKYRVGALLGSGTTGSVYTGFDEELNRAVAIKFYARRHASSGVRTLPVREARAASALNHPNIITIHEVIETVDTAAIVMELAPGQTLRALAGQGPSLSDILHWSRQLASALAVAHAHDLIHGDIKPENIMVREDSYVKLLDFGLAVSTQSDQRAAALTGTPRYLSPEQCMGNAASPASDVFAFGVLLYELTTGRHPFQANGMLGLLQAIASADPARPACANPKIPRSLDRLILEMLSKRPEARPTSQQTAERLATIARQLSEHSLFGIAARWWAVAVFTVAVLAIAAATSSSIGRQPRERLDLTRMNARPLAARAGLETVPSISPDGVWVALLYRVHARDRAQLQVQATQGGPPVVIDSSDLVLEGPAAWSPDSRELAFTGARAGKRSIYRASRTGGPLTLIAECVSACEIDWSPDGRWLAISDVAPGQTTFGISLLDPANGQRRAVVPPGSRPVSTPRFSPDGKWIAFSRQVSINNLEIWVTPATGGAVRSITNGTWWLGGFGWSSDGRSLIATSGRKAGKHEMWQFPVRGKGRAGARCIV